MSYKEVTVVEESDDAYAPPGFTPSYPPPESYPPVPPPPGYVPIYPPPASYSPVPPPPGFQGYFNDGGPPPQQPYQQVQEDDDSGCCPFLKGW
ncbi:leucine-rich repeat extensin-like protein 1 [Papaver somniferum]|uniref:leucine-rich repeat extensin-like protein 1 n=1 Tax=Papaver somniferum TaxID=3469 RepID=UPI000E6F5BAE|nr:leucine-rich repeat extensin-like protein 1 [Papaver somniferum]